MYFRFVHWKLALILADLLGLLVSFYAGFFLRTGEFYGHVYVPGSHWYVAAVLAVFYILDLYNPWSQHSSVGVHFRSLGGSLLAGAVCSLAVYMTADLASRVYFGRGVVFLSFAFFAPFAFFTRWFVHRRVQPHALDIRLLLLASPQNAAFFQSEIDRRGGLWNVAYLLDSAPGDDLARVLGERVIRGGLKRRLAVELSRSWTAVVVATDRLTPQQTQVLLDVRMKGQPVYDLSGFYERFFFKVPLFYLQHSWFVLNRGFLILENPVSRRVKAVTDKVLAAIVLIPGLPLMGLAALLVLMESGAPVLYRQERTGLRRRPFTLLKIRTMVKDAEKDGARWASVQDERITRIGRFLRVSRLDELPQLFNVLRGDMSFIGPRPERAVFDEMIEKEVPFYNLRHVIQPGVTGWAQVMYPYGASIEDAWQKLEYDLYYIKNYTPILDLSILVKTVRVILFGRGR